MSEADVTMNANLLRALLTSEACESPNMQWMLESAMILVDRKHNGRFLQAPTEAAAFAAARLEAGGWAHRSCWSP